MGGLHDMLVSLDVAYHLPSYARIPVTFVRGEGMRLYDDEGAEYLDFVSGLGAVNLGHAHPAVAEAVCAQMRKLVHVTNLYHVEHRAQLAEVLVSLAGGGFKAFFANSGAEANEAAIKLARRWGRETKGGSAVGIVTAEMGFHGRTLATLAATGQPSKQELFEPLPQGFTHVPLNDIAALEAAVDEDTCAVLLEPMQGESGVWPCAPEYLDAARSLCDERGALLVLDEVQTGFWRTGEAFAHQGYGVKPDVMTLAKAVANGLPMGAVLARTDVADLFQPGMHGSTFGGGPVLCAAALATIAALRSERLGENASSVGAYFSEELRALAEKTGAIDDVRGKGLMLAVSLAEPVAQELAADLLGQRLVVNAVGERIVRFLPPLVCRTTEVDTLLERFAGSLEGA